VTWAKFCDGFLDHPKVLKAGEDAANLFMRGCIWCSKHLTDGAIPREALRALTVRRDAPALAARLVVVNLWELTPDGWQVHDWRDHNPTRESVEGKREKTREKVAAWREKHAKPVTPETCEHNCNPVTCEVCNRSVTQPPSRPVPSRPEEETTSLQSPSGEPPSGATSTDPAEAPKATKGKRAKRAPEPDTIPLPGTLARRIFDAIVGDRALAPITGNPGDAALRWADPDAFPGVDVLAEVKRAGEYASTKPGRYTDGRSFVRGWLQRKADEVARAPKAGAFVSGDDDANDPWVIAAAKRGIKL